MHGYADELLAPTPKQRRRAVLGAVAIAALLTSGLAALATLSDPGDPVVGSAGHQTAVDAEYLTGDVGASIRREQ